MRIVFMGTPDFASASLEALLGAGYEVAAAVTQPCGSVSRRSINLCPFAVSEGRVSDIGMAPFYKIQQI